MTPLPQDGTVLSGADCTLAFSGQAFSFSHEDLARRALDAAKALGLVERPTPPDPGTARDFSALVLAGRLPVPESAAGGAALALATGVIVGGLPELVYWLRKLVYRAAWIDARVADGRVAATYDDRSATFSYSVTGLDLAPARRDDLPGWASGPAPRRAP